MNTPSEFTLQFESHAVRVQLDEHERRWFNANDICTALELLNPCAALAQHVGAENVSKRKTIDAVGWTKHANYLNESGVYALLIGSTKEAAKRFRQWLTDEALPAAQKAGHHIIPLHSAIDSAPSAPSPFQHTENHTMNAITPFQFESKDVRIQLDEANAPWFNANDVCAVLEFGNPHQAIESHVDVEDLQKLEAPTAGGRQRVNHINESGLYSLIMGSTKPAAKRFKRWVTSEVLPTLRKTGTYSTPGALPTLPGPTQDRIAALLLIGQYISTVPGVKPGIAAAATLACIKSNTNLTTEEIRRALPALRDPLCMLNATQLGKQLHCSAKAANQLLASSGFQFRNERDAWELTEAGRVGGEAIPYSRNGHSSYQILWNPTVLDSLKVAA
ncbi:Bro-N domain-containing protein [Xylella fastidiosa subsp. multiplex]|uniref:BRO-N domain-containing protein n=3 Tax=Xylella fastidiosa TaxID=2371 RepID=UPI0003144EA4|nr:Bro-N domain-containing protein [Xylella fastidiosa]KAJ4851709.1 Bro-N domain-containing protein [Xylella fastidiosa subsp. multiplex]KAJ4853169.1 Bro-N domain-containing protein [Xylella fastidiosa subsp. multiplex]KAJ4853996.1 Bro-N domain-containing protein [Xylella fastidiosa subsp. multiplex]MDC6410226.1 Bro-N domain-containing protein [Xylella fastidiosa subsp. multiplex]MDC6411109.1 Bro-N domain-containing protein [Xylella fastidiosa subsp. multiplex]